MKSLRTAEPLRGEHFFDTIKDGGIVTRTMRNHCSWRLPGQPLQESKALIEPGVALVGSFAPMRQHSHAPLQSFIGNTHDPDYQCAASCRLANNPACQIDMRPLDALPSRLTEEDGIIRFPGVWLHTTKTYQPTPSKLLGVLRLERPGHPDKFRYSLDVPDGMRLEFPSGENRVRILDSQGVEKMHILAPQGWDSSTVNPESPDGRRPVRVAMKEAGTIRVDGRDCVVVELEPSRDDLATAIYPVVVERNPTVQITGTTDIEDSMLYLTYPTYNYGSYTNGLAKLDTMRTVIRIASDSIPGGNITGFRLYQYFAADYNVEIRAYFVADANDWPEGTGVGAVQAGMSCWDQCKQANQNWAGHPTLGCSVSGTDFDADVAPPTLTPGTSGWKTFTLDQAWPPLWRDGARAANGIILDTLSGIFVAWKSTEDAEYPLYLEIDREEAAGGAAQRFFMMGGGG